MGYIRNNRRKSKGEDGFYQVIERGEGGRIREKNDDLGKITEEEKLAESKEKGNWELSYRMKKCRKNAYKKESK